MICLEVIRDLIKYQRSNHAACHILMKFILGMTNIENNNTAGINLCKVH